MARGVRESTLRTSPQGFGVYPSRKFEGAAHHDVAAAVSAAVSAAAALEFVRRLALAVMTGNGDMRLKNWSLIYRDEGSTAGKRSLRAADTGRGVIMLIDAKNERAAEWHKVPWRNAARKRAADARPADSAGGQPSKQPASSDCLHPVVRALHTPAFSGVWRMS